jgi:hypothetical protein
MKSFASLVLGLVLGSSVGHAQPIEAVASSDDTHDQAVAAAVGFAGGGGWTPGGLHLDASYLLQLGSRDWLDIGLGFTLGGSTPACFSDRNGGYACDHGVAQGEAIGFAAGLRHYLGDRDDVQPFVRGGVGVAFVRFPSDVIEAGTDIPGVTMPTKGMNGVAVTVHAGAGVRRPLTRELALIAAAELFAGSGGFAGTADAQDQLGFAITLGAELRP